MRRVAVCVSLLVLYLNAGAAVAAESPAVGDSSEPHEEAAGPNVGGEDSGGIETITITSEKRATDAQTTPISLTALDGAFLDEAGISGMEQLSFQVPNLHYGSLFGFSIITIRGVIPSAGDASTAVHIDGVYQNNPYVPSSLTFYDTERVEVLRGPQGTLYGRNATGGTMNIITRKPTYEYEFSGDLLAGAYDDLFARGVVNAPIVEDRIALRVAGYVRVHDGYQRNLLTDVHNDWADDTQNWGLRAQTLIQPTDSLEVIVRGNYGTRGGVGFAQKIDGDFPVVQDLIPGLPLPPQQIYLEALPNPEDPREIYLDQIGSTDLHFWNASSTISWEPSPLPLLGDTRFEVVGGFQEMTRDNVFDADMSSEPLVVTNIADVNREWTLDAHFTNAEPATVDWVLGAFYLGSQTWGGAHTSSLIPIRFALNAPPVLIADTTVLQSDDNELQSWAVYGQGTYNALDDRLAATFGLRYSNDWRSGHALDAPVCLNAPALGNPCTIPPLDSEREDRWDQVTGALKLDYQLSDRNMVYASGTRGYKSGTIEHDVPLLGAVDLNDPSTWSYAPVPNARPEVIWAFEVGSKNRFFDDHFQANGTFFYYDYSDLQVSQIVDTVIVTQNAGAARLFGLELELAWVPRSDITVTGSFSYLNGRYTDFFGFTAEEPAVLRDFSGQQMVGAPEFSGSITAMYDWDLRRFGRLTPQAQMFAQSEIYFRPSNTERDRQAAYVRFNLRLRWTAQDDRFYLEGFVDNVGDQDVKSALITGPQLIGSPLWSAYEAPRTWGVRFGFRL
jgi:iron complex outermembrane receptor protein